MRAGFSTSRLAAVLAGSLLSLGAVAPSPTPAPKCLPPTSEPPSQPETTDAMIGRLERDRSTRPQKLAAILGSNLQSDPQAAARAAMAIGRLQNPDGVDALATVLLDRKTPETVKAAAAFGLGVIKAPAGIPALRIAAQAGPGLVAGLAADSLGRIGGNDAVETLVRVLGNADPIARGKAAVGLGEAVFPSRPPLDAAHRQAAARALDAAWQSERDSEVRWRIAWAVARGYYAEDAELLRQMLRSDSELVKVFALKGVAKFGDRSFAIGVRLLKADPSWRVRIEVRNALAALKDTTEVDVTPPKVPKEDAAEPAPLPRDAPQGEHPQVALVTTKGVVVVEFFPDVAPYQVRHFLRLVDCGFFDGLDYFRVIPDFVVQGGDPTNTGEGGPGYTVPAEINPVEQLSGAIALGLEYDAKKNVPLVDSGGSQYYITQSPQLHLDEGFTTIGRVVRGMAVIDAIMPHNQGDKKAPADKVLKAYRIAPVTDQSAEVEQRLRTSEIGYTAN